MTEALSTVMREGWTDLAEPQPLDHFAPSMIGRLVEVQVTWRYFAPASYGWSSEETEKKKSWSGRLLDYSLLNGIWVFRFEEDRDNPHEITHWPGRNSRSRVAIEVTVVPPIGDSKLALEYQQVRELMRGRGVTVVMTHRISSRPRDRRARLVRRATRR